MHRGDCPLWRRVLLGQAFLVVVCTGASAWEDSEEGLVFRQVWGYVFKGEERSLTGFEPITDVGWFSAVVNDIGRLDPSPARPQLAETAGLQRRVHLVISAPANRSLMYWCLAKDLQTREGLIQDIVAAGHGFDGVQIDFESIRPQEGQAYLSFLRDLKEALPAGKVLSVAVPARTKSQEDAYDYPAIAVIADKVLVMAYDEHWRTGSPGPIASVEWCRQVSRFARQNVPSHKLVMGLPLYGRVWQVDEVARALKYPDTLDLIKRCDKNPSRTEEGIPFFLFQTTVKAEVYYEDLSSLTAKLRLYRDEGIEAVGFWRVGQGPAALWKRLSVREP
jgi:spore germination protein